MYVSTVGNAVDSLETSAQFAGRSDPLKWKWVAIAAHHSLYSFCIAALHNSSQADVLTWARGKHDSGDWYQGGSDPIWYRSRRDEVDGSPAYRIRWEATTEAPPADSKTAKGNPRLIDFWTALARVQDPMCWMGNRLTTRALTLTDEEMLDIAWLADAVRNQLMHFTPKGYLISISSVMSSVAVVLRAVEFLALQSHSIISAEEGWQTRAASACVELRDALDAASM